MDTFFNVTRVRLHLLSMLHPKILDTQLVLLTQAEGVPVAALTRLMKLAEKV